MKDWNSCKDPSQNECELTIDKPARYRIRVAGFLDDTWSDRLGGLALNSSEQGRKIMDTTLCGTLIDQAALFGVLKALYDLHMPLLSVEFLRSNPYE